MNEEPVVVYFNDVLYRGTHDPYNYRRTLPVYFTYGENGENIARRLYTSSKRPDTEVYTFTPKRALKLLDMSRASSIMYLKKVYKENSSVVEAISKTFILQNQYTAVVRRSKKELDYIVATAVCNAGFDGYYSPKMRKHKEARYNMHQEIAICNAEYKISGVKLNEHLTNPIVKETKKRKVLSNIQIPNKNVMKRIKLNF